MRVFLCLLFCREVPAVRRAALRLMLNRIIIRTVILRSCSSTNRIIKRTVMLSERNILCNKLSDASLTPQLFIGAGSIVASFEELTLMANPNSNYGAVMLSRRNILSIKPWDASLAQHDSSVRNFLFSLYHNRCWAPMPDMQWSR